MSFRPTILIIDDSPDVRGILREALATEGYEVLEAADGREGVRVYKENQPDLALVDIVMPEKGRHRDVAFDPDAVVFTMSGRSEDYQEVARVVGARRGFGKPVRLEELLEAVEEALQT